MKHRGVLKYANRRLRRRILAGAEPRWLTQHRRAAYIRAITLASPDWIDREAMRSHAQRADHLERITGIPHVCDHIVPLSHPMVCGLNVPWNVQVIPHRANASKSNHYAPDQLEMSLLQIPAQLELRWPHEIARARVEVAA